jgi:hypothetical protein
VTIKRTPNNGVRFFVHKNRPATLSFPIDRCPKEKITLAMSGFFVKTDPISICKNKYTTDFVAD